MISLAYPSPPNVSIRSDNNRQPTSLLLKCLNAIRILSSRRAHDRSEDIGEQSHLGLGDIGGDACQHLPLDPPHASMIAVVVADVSEDGASSDIIS